MNDRTSDLRDMALNIGKDVAKISEEVLSLPKFSTHSACSHIQGHHYGQHGLSQHTFEVASLCMVNAGISDMIGNRLVNTNVLFLSALFHDVGKIWDCESSIGSLRAFEGGGGGFPVIWTGTTHKRKIHHISKSAIIWSKAVEKTQLFKDIEDEVLHCILSHHGSRQFGSPVAPLSREAWILHLCDSLSARSNDCDRLDMLNLPKT